MPRDRPRPDQPFTAVHFRPARRTREELVEISSFNEAPGNPPATVVAHEVRFDPERQQWFADVDIPGGRTALLRLGLVRYQPESPNGARASRMVTSDWIPLQAPRTMTIRSRSGTGIDYDVSLTGKHIEDRSFIARCGGGPSRPRPVPPSGRPPTSPSTTTRSARRWA